MSPVIIAVAWNGGGERLMDPVNGCVVDATLRLGGRYENTRLS